MRFIEDSRGPGRIIDTRTSAGRSMLHRDQQSTWSPKGQNRIMLNNAYNRAQVGRHGGSAARAFDSLVTSSKKYGAIQKTGTGGRKRGG